MEEIEELHAEQHGEELIEGKPRICVSSSFRAVQLAFSKLWHETEGIPKEATVEERKRYVEWESEVRDKFLTFSDDNLFIGELDE